MWTLPVYSQVRLFGPVDFDCVCHNSKETEMFEEEAKISVGIVQEEKDTEESFGKEEQQLEVNVLSYLCIIKIYRYIYIYINSVYICNKHEVVSVSLNLFHSARFVNSVIIW